MKPNIDRRLLDSRYLNELLKLRSENFMINLVYIYSGQFLFVIKCQCINNLLLEPTQETGSFNRLSLHLIDQGIHPSTVDAGCIVRTHDVTWLFPRKCLFILFICVIRVLLSNTDISRTCIKYYAKLCMCCSTSRSDNVFKKPLSFSRQFTNLFFFFFFELPNKCLWWHLFNVTC